MAKKKIISFLITLAVLILLDSIVISQLILPLYRENLSGIIKIEPSILSSLIVWSLITLGIMKLISPISKNKKQSFSNGAFLGLIIYGVYDLTNYAIIRNWTIKMVVFDIIWGMLLCGITSLINKSLTK